MIFGGNIDCLIVGRDKPSNGTYANDFFVCNVLSAKFSKCINYKIEKKTLHVISYVGIIFLAFRLFQLFFKYFSPSSQISAFRS